MFKLISFKSDGAFWPFADRSDFDTAVRPRSVFGGLLAAPWRIVAAVAKELATRRTMRLLENLDERTLRDIGLERDQISHAARQGRLDVRLDIARWS